MANKNIFSMRWEKFSQAATSYSAWMAHLHPIFLTLLLFAISILPRLPNLNESLWYDELWSTHIMLENWIQFGNVILADLHPPFYTLFMFIWIHIFGDTEILVRLPSLIFGILSIALTYILASRFADKNVALMAAFFMVISPVHIWYSQEARPYATNLFLLLSSIFAYYQLVETKQKTQVWHVLYFVATLVAVFSHLYMSIYLFAISLLCIRNFDRRKRNILILNVVIFGLLAFYMGLKQVLGNVVTESPYLRPFTFGEWWSLFFNWFPFGNSVNKGLLFYSLQILFLYFFVQGITSFVQLRRGSESVSPYWFDICLYLFVPPIALLILSTIRFTNIYIERSLIFILPFFYIVLAKGVLSVKSRSIRNASIIIVVIVNIFILSSFYQKADEWTVYKPNPDWRDTAGYFQNVLGNTSKNLVIYSETPATPLTYYDDRFIEEGLGQGQDHTKLSILERLIGEDNPFSIAVSSELERYRQSIEARIQKARLTIRYINRKKIADIGEAALDDDVGGVYIIHNKYWAGDIEELWQSIDDNPNITSRSSIYYKGITIIELVFNKH